MRKMIRMRWKNNRKSNSKHHNILKEWYGDNVARVGDKLFIAGDYVGHVLKKSIIMFPEYSSAREDLLVVSQELGVPIVVPHQ